MASRQPRYAVGDQVCTVSKDVMLSFKRENGIYVTPEGLFINSEMIRFADRVATIQYVSYSACRYILNECDYLWDEYLLTDDLDEEEPQRSQRLQATLFDMLCPKEECP